MSLWLQVKGYNVEVKADLIGKYCPPTRDNPAEYPELEFEVLQVQDDDGQVMDFDARSLEDFEAVISADFDLFNQVNDYVISEAESAAERRRGIDD